MPTINNIDDTPNLSEKDSKNTSPYIKWLEEYLDFIQGKYNEDYSFNEEEAKAFIRAINIVMDKIQQIINNKFEKSKREGKSHNKTEQVNAKISPIIKKHKLYARLEDIDRGLSLHDPLKLELHGLMRKVATRRGENSYGSHDDIASEKQHKQNKTKL